MKTVAVIFGGRSAEHDVSIITAHIPIIDALHAAGGYDVWPVYIAKDGSWYADKAMNDLAFFKDPNYEGRLAGMKKVRLVFDRGLVLAWPGVFGKEVHVDVAFPAMHGTYGEDGSLMGVLRMAGVPFVGCDMAASAVAMDKALTKQVLAEEGVPVVPFHSFTAREWESDKDAILARIGKLSYPLFVKPVHLGSSIGITKAKTPDELLNAIEVALHYDDKVLVEEGIEPLIEVTLPIIGHGEPRFAHIERPLNKTELFDFNDKYLSGGKGGKGGESGGANNAYSQIPAEIGDALTARVKELAARTWSALGLSGIARIDFLIRESTGDVFVNEINTLPGSLYHHNWRKAGVSNVELVTSLIRFAEERFAEESRRTFTFSSDILQKVGGGKKTGA